MSAFKIECEVCYKTPNVDGVALYRTGGKGPDINPHWRCTEHLDLIMEVDSEVLVVTTIIESNNTTKH